jgi:hypothetical protein
VLDVVNNAKNNPLSIEEIQARDIEAQSKISTEIDTNDPRVQNAKSDFVIDKNSLKLVEDIEVLKAVIKDDPMALEYVDDSLKSDVEVVKTAFENNASSLKFASNLATLEILKDNGLALEYADDSIKSDINAVKTAFEHDKKSL